MCTQFFISDNQTYEQTKIKLKRFLSLIHLCLNINKVGEGDSNYTDQKIQ